MKIEDFSLLKIGDLDLCVVDRIPMASTFAWSPMDAKLAANSGFQKGENGLKKNVVERDLRAPPGEVGLEIP